MKSSTKGVNPFEVIPVNSQADETDIPVQISSRLKRRNRLGLVSTAFLASVMFGIIGSALTEGQAVPACPSPEDAQLLPPLANPGKAMSGIDKGRLLLVGKIDAKMHLSPKDTMVSADDLSKKAPLLYLAAADLFLEKADGQLDLSSNLLGYVGGVACEVKGFGDVEVPPADAAVSDLAYAGIVVDVEEGTASLENISQANPGQAAQPTELVSAVR